MQSCKAIDEVCVVGRWCISQGPEDALSNDAKLLLPVLVAMSMEDDALSELMNR